MKRQLMRALGAMALAACLVSAPGCVPDPNGGGLNAQHADAMMSLFGAMSGFGSAAGGFGTRGGAANPMGILRATMPAARAAQSLEAAKAQQQAVRVSCPYCDTANLGRRGQTIRCKKCSGTFKVP